MWEAQKDYEQNYQLLHSVCIFTSATKGSFLYFTILLERKAYLGLPFYVSCDFIDIGNTYD